MEGSGILCIISLLFINYGILTAADEFDMKVSPDSHVTVYEGENPKFLCSTKKDAVYLINNPLQWVQIGRPGTQQRNISALGNVNDGLKSEFKIELKNLDDGGMGFELSFLEGIKKSYDGFFLCRIVHDGTVLASKQIEVHVIRAMEKLSFSLAGTTLDQTGEPAYPKRIKEGTYTAVCKAERSNPPAVVAINLDGKKQDATTSTHEDKSVTEPPQAFTVERSSTFTVNIMDKDKILECEAMVNKDKNMKRKIQFKLDVYTEIPEINCGNKTASVGNLFVDIECFVKLPGINCKNIQWENGDNGDRYTEGYSIIGGTTEPPKEYIVSCQESAKEPNTVRTVFRINEVKTKDFKTEYFVVYINKHGTSKREPVVLAQDHNLASSLQYGIYLLCSMVVTTLFL